MEKMHILKSLTAQNIAVTPSVPEPRRTIRCCDSDPTDPCHCTDSDPTDAANRPC